MKDSFDIQNLRPLLHSDRSTAILDLLTGGSPQPQQELPPLKPWSDVSSKLDPNMPREDYDKLRLQYFQSEVRPRIRPDEDVNATYQEFLKRTERPFDIRAKQMFQDIGQTFGKLAVEMGEQVAMAEFLGPAVGLATKSLMAESTGQAALAKIVSGGLTFGTYNALKAKEGDRVNAGLRGAGWGALTEGALGLMFGWSEKAAKATLKAGMTEKVAPEISQKAANEAADEWESVLGKVTPATAEEREQASAALRERAQREREEAGLSVGLPDTGPAQLPPRREMEFPEPHPLPPSEWEDALGRPQSERPSPEQLSDIEARRRDQVEWDRAMEQMRAREVHPVTLPSQEAASKMLGETVGEARKQGYLTGPMVETPGIKGLRVTVKDAQGVAQVLNVPRGKESDITGIVEATLANGGSLDRIEFHPASRPRASQFMSYFAEKAEAENAPIRMKVPKGTVGEHARNLNRMGLKAWVLDDSTIQVGPEAAWKKAQRARELNQRLGAEKAGKLIPPPPDDISKKMMRIGELRNQARLAVSPNEVYTEMHHLAGEVSQHYQLSRTQIGQLALDYFTRNAAQENPESAIPLLEKYRGRGAPFGVVEGEKAPPGMKDLESRLPGLLMPVKPGEKIWAEMGGRIFRAEERVRPTGTTLITEKTPEEIGFRGGQTGEGTEAVRIFARPATIPRSVLPHESIHDGIAHAELSNQMPQLMRDHEKVFQGIRQGLLKDYPDYRGKSLANHANEAFTWAATAVRMGDDEAMKQLVEWDESQEEIEKMVNTVAGRLYENAMHGDTAPIRAFLRRMNDLVRRTQPEVSDAIGKGKLYGYNTWFDPEIASWVMRDGEGREVLKKDLNEVFDWMDQADPSSHFPDQLHEGYYMGLKGPAVPPGEEPIDATSTPEYEKIPLGAEAFAAFRKPTLDFAAMVQKKLNKFGIDINFYDRFANADTARRAANPIMEQLGADRDGLMTGVTNARLRDYGEVLRTPEDQWSAMQAAHKLDTEDMARIRGFKEWSDANERQGGVSLIDALKGMHQVRAAGGAKKAYQDIPDAIADAIRHGQLGHDDLHVGQVSQWVIRKSIEDRHMGEPIQAVEDLLKIKAKDGTPLFKSLEWPIRNYVNYMRGIPDQGQRILQDWMKSMVGFMNRRLESLNQVLPESWRIAPIAHPEDLWGKYQLLLFTAGLGARPAIFIRDTFQSMHAMAVMGPTAFFRGMQMALTPEGRQMFKDAGAAIEGRNIRQIFGDLSQDIPVAGSAPTTFTKFADLLLAPSRIGHNVGRSIAYLGEYSRALEEIGAFRRGEFAADELANRTSVWFQDPAPRSRLLGMAADPKVPLEEAAKQFGLALNDATQFALRSGTQPALLRTGFGRVLGQYGTWPANYLEFLRKGGARLLENPRKALPAIGWWAVMNYGAFEGLKSMGIDASKWLFFSPAGYAGSPNEELLRTLMAAPEESATGLEARRKLHEIPWEFVPTGVEIQSIIRAINGGEVNVPRLLGFKPLTQQQDQDLEDWLEIESGFKRPPRSQ